MQSYLHIDKIRASFMLKYLLLNIKHLIIFTNRNTVTSAEHVYTGVHAVWDLGVWHYKL